MTAGSVERAAAPPPILVLGLGSLLLGDDAVGLRLLEELRGLYRDEEQAKLIEFADGGTLGLMLLGLISHRPAVVILDAVGFGGEPGSMRCLRDEQIWQFRARRARTAHDGNALELLETARLTGGEPESIIVVGIEPASMRTGIELSPVVEQTIPAAVGAARKILDELLAAVRQPMASPSF